MTHAPQPSQSRTARWFVGFLLLVAALVAAVAMAQTNAMFITPVGDVGIGTDTPGTMAGRQSRVHVTTDDPSAGGLLVENAAPSPGGRAMLELRNNGATRLDQADTASGVTWRQTNGGGRYRLVDLTDAGIVEFDLERNGNLTISGSLTTAMNTLPDYVFESDYALMPLDELADFVAENKHLPNIPSAAEIEEKGSLNLSDFQQRLLEKIEELTLYTLEQQQTIERQQATIEDLSARLTAVEGQ